MKTIFYANRGCGFTSRRRYKRAAKGARQRRRRKLLRAWRLVRQRQGRSRTRTIKRRPSSTARLANRQLRAAQIWAFMRHRKRRSAGPQKAAGFTQKPAIQVMRRAAKIRALPTRTDAVPSKTTQNQRIYGKVCGAGNGGGCTISNLYAQEQSVKEDKMRPKISQKACDIKPEPALSQKGR